MVVIPGGSTSSARSWPRPRPRTSGLPVHFGAESLIILVLGLCLGQDLALAVDPPTVI